MAWRGEGELAPWAPPSSHVSSSSSLLGAVLQTVALHPTVSPLSWAWCGEPTSLRVCYASFVSCILVGEVWGQHMRGGMSACACGGASELLFMHPLPNPDLSSPGAEGDAEKLVSLNDIADVEAFISREEVAVVGFFQVCWQRVPSARWEPDPALVGEQGWLWCKHLQTAAPSTERCWGCDRSVGGLGEGCVEREMEQGRIVKMLVGALEREKGKCCRGRKRATWVAKKASALARGEWEHQLLALVTEGRARHCLHGGAEEAASQGAVLIWVF